MNGKRLIGLGLGLMLGSSVGYGQAPAARFGKIEGYDLPLEVRPIRAQNSESPIRQVSNLPMPMPTREAPPSWGLPAPRSTATNLPATTPNYGTGQPIPIGQPVPMGQPVPIGQPVPMGQPVPIGQPYPMDGSCPTGMPVDGMVPSVLPGGACPAPADTGHWGGLLATPTAQSHARFQLSADFLMWWTSGLQAPALVTTSSVASSGILGAADTRILYGNGTIGDTYHPGFRVGGVYWLGDKTWGLDGDLIYLATRSTDYTDNTSVNPLLARPFFNLNQSIPFSEIVAAPGLATGSILVDSETSLWGGQINLRRKVCPLPLFPCSRLDLFGGFRYLSLSDEITITESFNRTAGSSTAIGVPTAQAGFVTDRFRTENQFYGAQIGAVNEIRRGRWTLETRAAIALGTVFQQVKIDGAQSILFTNGTTGNFAGGLLAQPGVNIGTFTQKKFGVLPEVGLKLGFDLTSRWRATFGYNLMYLNSVVRPGDQMPTALDVTRIPNFPLPGNLTPVAVPSGPPMKTTDFFAQGISFGLQYTW